MKGIILLTVLLGLGTAQASTVTLASSPCTSTYVCASVTNDAGDTIEALYQLNYDQLMVFVNGVEYSSTAWGARYTVTPTGISISDAVLYEWVNGTRTSNTITASVNFQIVHTGPCTRVCPTKVTLTDGTLVF